MAHDGPGRPSLLLSTAPAQRADRRLAIAVVLLSFAVFVVTVPFAKVQLAARVLAVFTKSLASIDSLVGTLRRLVAGRATLTKEAAKEVA